MSSQGDAMKQRYDRYWRSDTPPPLKDPLSGSRRQLLWDSIAALGDASGRQLLDAGCGSGELVREAQGRGLVAAGIDVSAAAIERARLDGKNATFFEHSVESLPWPVSDEAFDIVVSFEVIEHLLEPQALLEGARRALKVGGYLALTTPYHGVAKNLLIAALYFDKHFSVEGDHIRFFTDRGLRRLLAKAGFECLEVAHLGRVWPLWENTFVWARRCI